MPVTAKKKYESARQLERQRNILATARALLEEEGYAGMTMRGLAKAAGVAQGTLYNLYSSKDELILAAVDDLLTEIGEQAAERSDAEGIDAILTLAEATGERTQSMPKYADAIARALFRAQPDDPIVDVLFVRSLPYLRRHLTFAKNKGHLREDVDVEALAHHLIGQGWGVILLWLMGLVPLKDMVKERLRSDLMTLAGVAKGRTRSRLEDDLRAL